MSLPTLPGAVVSCQWLADHLGAEGLVVLDATTLRVPSPLGGTAWLSGYDGYLIDGHIPGAVFADLLEEFSDPSAALPFTLPGAAAVDAAARAVDIGAASRVVVYDSANGRFAARLWWLLRSFGFDAVAVLDGGLAAWRAAGLPIATGHVAAAAVDEPFVPLAREGFWADRSDIQAVLAGKQNAALVCTLPAADFRGDGDAPGHIPGSVNLPAGALIDRQSNLLRGPVELAQRSAAVDPAQPVILYCGAGILASLAALALSAQGYADVRVYDGSLAEWAADENAPLEKGDSPTA